MLSVSSIPILLKGDPVGPIENAMTYMVLPFMEFLKIAPAFLYASAGAIQLFVGPASRFLDVQINVRFSVLATSLTAVLCKTQPGHFP